MTTETKAPTAEDVEKWHARLAACLSGSTDLMALLCLAEAALLGVQVPGLKEENAALKHDLARYKRAADIINGQWDKTSAEVSSLQARVAELEREQDRTVTVRAERDALRAQVERAAGLLTGVRVGLKPDANGADRALYLAHQALNAALSTPPASISGEPIAETMGSGFYPDDE